MDFAAAAVRFRKIRQPQIPNSQRYVVFLIRANKKLRRKFDFRLNADTPPSSCPIVMVSCGINRAGSDRCTPKAHLLTMAILNTMLMLPRALHPIEYGG